MGTTKASKFMPIEDVHTKIVGVQAESIRQVYLKQMKEKDIKALSLVREPNNTWDSNAVAVYAKLNTGNCKIGYIQNKARVCTGCKKEYAKVATGIELCESCSGQLTRTGLATELSKWMDQGHRYAAVVQQITGGEDSKSLGCNILVQRIG